MVGKRSFALSWTVLLLLLFPVAFDTVSATETAFFDGFSTGSLERSWIFYGDTTPLILDSLGLPPPCFNNNGDSMGGSGVVSREVFDVCSGFFVESDVFFDCSERGTWVTAQIGLVTPGFRSGDRTGSDYVIALMGFSYSGELDWCCPHRETVLAMDLYGGTEKIYNSRYLHQNQFLGGWHRLRIEINPDRTVSYSIDDSVWCISDCPIPDTVSRVRITLGDRSSDWGIALHDNVTVGRL